MRHHYYPTLKSNPQQPRMHLWCHLKSLQYLTSLLSYRRYLVKPNKEDHENEVLETLRKVQVNIPLLDAIKQVPRYAKFLRDLCIRKRMLKGNEVMYVGETCSTMLQRKLHPTFKDPGSFIIPCMIGKSRTCKAMLDLGVSINVMPYNVILL